MALIESLPPGPLDIVGDVHGEFDALVALLAQLGYGGSGHPEKRRLVFVGDLVDRGPQVPAVLDLCRSLLTAGSGLMVLGNHEINLLLDDAKPGSGWYFDRRAERDRETFGPSQRWPAARRAELRDFLAAQPLILEREDLRIVHAAWLPTAVAALRPLATLPLLVAYQRWEEQWERWAPRQPWYGDWQAEYQQIADLHNPAQPPPPRPATALRNAAYALANPIRALTCGSEEPSPTPHFAGGRWRFVRRARWWLDYREGPPVVIGHYWRRWWDNNELFPGPPNGWLGPRHNVFCCDYSIGARWQERREQRSSVGARWQERREQRSSVGARWSERQAEIRPSRCRLVALRWPERQLVFDDGERLATV